MLYRALHPSSTLKSSCSSQVSRFKCSWFVVYRKKAPVQSDGSLAETVSLARVRERLNRSESRPQYDKRTCCGLTLTHTTFVQPLPDAFDRPSPVLASPSPWLPL